MSLSEKQSIFTYVPARTGPIRVAQASTPQRNEPTAEPLRMEPEAPAIARMTLSSPPPEPEGPAIARMVLRPAPINAGLPAELEASMLRVLTSQPLPGETFNAAFRRLEQSLCALFARLSPLQARALKARLEQPREGDGLAARFGRLVRDRQLRLLAFLGDARRREALGFARGRS